MKPTIFIHTNAKQRLGAIVSAHSFCRTTRQPDAFDVRLLEVEHYPALMAADGRHFRRGGHARVWRIDDLQSFSPLRFAVPDAMGHRGVALVVDPDVFAIGDVGELLAEGMQGHAIRCRNRRGYRGHENWFATSVMLLDCARLPHWDFEARLADLWAGRLDYVDWIELRGEARETIGDLGDRWNDFDRLEADTKLLHNTRRRTQPWKTGLPIDFTVRDHGVGPIPAAVVTPLVRWWHGRSRYLPHPDPAQEAHFYALLAELVDDGTVSQADLAREIAARHIRADSPALIDRHRGWTLPPAEVARAA